MTADYLHQTADRRMRPQQLPEEVANYVRQRIVSGQARPGQYIRIDKISQELGVSATPVREALLALRSEGFVQQEPNRGFVVTPLTRNDVRDLYWVQSVLGGELSARAAVNANPDFIRRLTRLMGLYDDAVERNDPVAIADLGPAFHREINLEANSHRLAVLLGTVVRGSSIRFFSNLHGQVDATRRDHPELIEAFASHDAERARRLMERHLLHGADILIESLESQGMWQETTDGV